MKQSCPQRSLPGSLCCSEAPLFRGQLPPIDYLTHYINAMYQGLLCGDMKDKPDGLGAIIDNDFNFILCEDWKNGNINGHTFIKMRNQMYIWGRWINNKPLGFIFSQIMQYKIIIPYSQLELINDSKTPKSIIYNQKRNQVYLTMIYSSHEHHIQSTSQQRRLKIKIQRVIKCKSQHRLVELIRQIFGETVGSSMLGIRQFLSFLFVNELINASRDISNLGTVDYDNENLFICVNEKSFKYNQHQDQTPISKNYRAYIQPYFHQELNLNNFQCQRKLGLVINYGKLTTKSLGLYAVYQSTYYPGIVDRYQLDGIGLSNRVKKYPVIGIYKNDLIVKQFLVNKSLLTPSNPNSKQTKSELQTDALIEMQQKLSYEHLKAISFINDHLLYKKIHETGNLIGELFRYVDMFEKLTDQKIGYDLISSDESSVEQKFVRNRQDEGYNSNKYENMKDLPPFADQGMKKQQQIGRNSNISIIDAFEEIYTPKSNAYINHQIRNERSGQRKKAGFITTKSPIKLSPYSKRNQQGSISPVTLKLGDNFRKTGLIKAYENTRSSRSKSKSPHKQKSGKKNQFPRWRI